MRGRSLLSLYCVLLASLALTAPAYANGGSGNHSSGPPAPPEPAKSHEPAKNTETPTSPEEPGHTSSSGDNGAGNAPAATPARPPAPSKAAAAASTVYVMRGRVVRIVAPSGAAVGSVSFRVTASSRLATRLRGMTITLALTRPTALRRGALVTVRLRAPVDALTFGFDTATALKVTAAG